MIIITHVHLVLGTIKGHSKMCSFVIQYNPTDVSSFEGAVARELHVHFSTISHLRCCFREFGSKYERPHNSSPPICFSMILHGPMSKDLYTIPGSWKCPNSSMACLLTRHVTNWACLGCSGLTCMTACSSSRQYPATFHSHWRGEGQHSKGHNQQPDELYAKEMCRAAWNKWWSK